MNTNDVGREIHEIRLLRRQTRLWQLATTGMIALTVIICVATLRDSVNGLLLPGPRQDQFSGALGARLRANVLPTVQTIISQALIQSKPDVQTAFTHLNDHVPEVAQASMTQLQLLQHDLPERGDTVLNATLRDTMRRRAANIQTLFPGTTEQQITTLTDNLTAESQDQLARQNDSLFSGHMQAINGIVGDLDKIEATETVVPGSETANWEMGLLLLDDFRTQLQQMEPNKSAAGGKTAAPSAKNTAGTAGETKS